MLLAFVAICVLLLKTFLKRKGKFTFEKKGAVFLF